MTSENETREKQSGAEGAGSIAVLAGVKETRRSSTVDTKRQLPKRAMKCELEECRFYAPARGLIWQEAWSWHFLQGCTVSSGWKNWHLIIFDELSYTSIWMAMVTSNPFISFPGTLVGSQPHKNGRNLARFFLLKAFDRKVFQVLISNRVYTCRSKNTWKLVWSKTKSKTCAPALEVFSLLERGALVAGTFNGKIVDNSR